MYLVFIISVLVISGLCFGSFACATTWRLRDRQLEEDKKNGEKINEKEFESLNKLFKGHLWSGRSKCVHCGYTLTWYDLIPVVSWLALGGKCRKCHKKIGVIELLAELGLAAFFVTSYVFWPNALSGFVSISQFVIWLISGVLLTMIFIYDLRWFLIPTRLSYLLIALGVINSALTIIVSIDRLATIVSIVVAAALLSGIYLLIYFASHKKWIGLGDVILGFGLALLLAGWEKAYVALFAANFIGCLIVIPGMVNGKLKRDSHIPFGPLLILGFWIGGLCGIRIMSAILYGVI